MKKTLPILFLLAATALTLALLVSLSSPQSFGPRASVLMALADQEWEEDRYFDSAGHYLVAVALSASDTVLQSTLTLYLTRTQDLLHQGQFAAALDLCRDAVAISIDERSTASLCDRIASQISGAPQPPAAK